MNEFVDMHVHSKFSKTEQATENGKAQLARSLIKLRDEIDELLEDIGHG